MTVAREALRARLGGARRDRPRPPAAWREAAGGELAAGDPERAGPARAVIDSREVEPGDLFVGLPGAGADGGEFAAAALERGRLGRAGRPRARRARAAGDGTRPAPVIAVEDPLPRCTRWRAPGGASSAQGLRRHRLDRQDVDQGHPGGAAARRGAHARHPRELEHRDRPAADDPRGRPRHRGVGARDGHARRGPDRRAGRRCRAGRGRDRERRPGAPRAARHGRARRGRQGRADPRPARRAPPASSRPASRCSTRTCATTSTPGRSGRAARCSCCPSTAAGPRSRRAGRGRARAAATPSRTTCSTRWPPWRPRARSESAVGGRVDVRFSSLRGEVVELPGGVDRGERLLQRQPDVDAGRPRSPRGQRGRAPDRRARRHGRAGRRLGGLPPRDRRPRGRRRDRRARAGGREALDYTEGFEARPTRWRAPRRPARCWRSWPGPATGY